MLPSRGPSARPGACKVQGQQRLQFERRTQEGVRLERDLLVQGEHLLLLVLVVVHLSAVGQLVVARLEHEEGQRLR